MPHMKANDSARAYAPAVRFALLAVLVAATIAWALANGRPATEPPPVVDTRLADHARDALVPACGSCHRSDLPSAKPAALAVFDLTKDPWWATINADQYESLLHRVRGTRDMTDEDRAAVETFVAAIRPPAPPTREP
jgi:mono/diheme cytochrome c family protein